MTGTTINQLAQSTETTPTVVLSYGLGEDSTAILLRWLEDPTSRDFDLDDLVVVTAMTGNEWESTRTTVETHVLPRLAAAGVRYIQAGRARRHVTTAGDGVVILDDSRTPTRLYLEGEYSLWDEMVESGTIPQSGGARMCSVHSKGDVLDPVIAAVTRGDSYRHIIGYEAGEVRRATKDALYNTALRTGEYPLIDWGWFRADAIAYTETITGFTIGKSACFYCPFAFANRDNRIEIFTRYKSEPAVGARTLLMEHLALALNPAQGLVGGKRLIDMITDEGMTDVLTAFENLLNEQQHALYEVRRILRPRKTDPTKLGNAARSVRISTRGTRQLLQSTLDRFVVEGEAKGLVVGVKGDDNIMRLYERRRGATFPAVERFFVVAPALALEKESTHFDQWWDDALRSVEAAQIVGDLPIPA